jgi:competence protein ComEA
MKKFITNYLTFTKNERIGIFSLLVLIVVFSFLPSLFPHFIKPKNTDYKNFENEIALLKFKQIDSNKNFYKNNDEDNYPNYYQPNQKSNYTYQPKGELFYFDPNTASTADWQRLGVRDKTIATILNYTSKGGHFYKPEDIGKIWGLHPDEVERLLPYIQIAAKENNGYKNYDQNKTYEKKVFTPSVVDVNNTDTSALIALPGIGSKLAQRIITFRDKLGGFYTIDQVAETFGLPDSTFQKIKSRLILNGKTIKQININTASLDELKSHPYIKYYLANAIVQYRTQHGKFAAAADIKNIMIVTDEIFNKVAPYLSAN